MLMTAAHLCGALHFAIKTLTIENENRVQSISLSLVIQSYFPHSQVCFEL